MSDIQRDWKTAKFGEEARKKALLVGTFPHGMTREVCEEHLQELALLCDTLGVDAVELAPCPLRAIDAGTFLGKGKIDELVSLREEKGCDLVIFDDEIKPSQQRNLEAIFKVPVLDRAEVILDVFAERAKTHEARLQIELAQVRYQYPRLKRMWTHLSRQRGGGVYQKGEGEKQLEIDKRILKQKIEHLEKEIKEVAANRAVQRQGRERTGIPVFAIVGYTNVGKSTLLNALTGAGVLAEDKLFATLDTTTRKFTLPNHQEILLIDTVGFIRKLPHQLIAAFKSTLEESLYADVLIHVVDASHPMAVEHAEATMDVLKELKADKKPIITVLNKVDQCTERSMIDRLRVRYPKTAKVSAKEKTGFEELQEWMTEELSNLRTVLKLKVPQSEYALISEIMRLGHVYYQDYEENDVIMRAEIPKEILHRVEPYRFNG